jgi:hypothetical protein
MAFRFKALSATLSIIAVVSIVAPGHAQQYQPSAGSMPGLPSNGRTAAVKAKVNLRNGPGPYSEIITTISVESRVRITGCSGEWCELTWNGRCGYAVARNISIGAPPRQVRPYDSQANYTGGYDRGPQPRHPGSYEPEPPIRYGEPGYYPPPADAYGPAYYKSPRLLWSGLGVARMVVRQRESEIDP